MKLLLSILSLISVVFHKIFYGVGQHIIRFTGLVKQVIENPALDIFVLATENKIDDHILAAFRAAFKQLYSTGDDDDITDEFINKTLQTDLAEQSKVWNQTTLAKLAALMYKELKENQITQVEADTIMQLAFAKYKLKGLGK